MEFIRVTQENGVACRLFAEMMYPYIGELNAHSHRPLPEQYWQKWIDSILSMQGPTDRHLELCYVDGEPIGFLYGKVDHKEHKGYIRPGWGYIMEFYVAPAHRRRGYGRQMFARLHEHFIRDGVTQMYLTADPVTGRPFWEAMGFATTGEISPDNEMEILVRDI